MLSLYTILSLSMQESDTKELCRKIRMGLYIDFVANKRKSRVSPLCDFYLLTVFRGAYNSTVFMRGSAAQVCRGEETGI
jgi:hypothetical protein